MALTGERGIEGRPSRTHVQDFLPNSLSLVHAVESEGPAGAQSFKLVHAAVPS